MAAAGAWRAVGKSRLMMMTAAATTAKGVAATGMRTAAVTTTKGVAATGPKAASGIMKPQPISPMLRSFLGANEVSRAQAIKKVWEYIKSRNLQNPKNKKEIFCDLRLKTLFNGKDTVGFLEIAGLLSKHFVKTA